MEGMQETLKIKVTENIGDLEEVRAFIVQVWSFLLQFVDLEPNLTKYQIVFGNGANLEGMKFI